MSSTIKQIKFKQLIKISKIILITGLLSASIVTVAFGEDSKYAGESFSIGVGGRGLAMGSAFHTLATGAEALWWNPAGLARTGSDKLNNMAFMHSERFGGEVDYNFLGYSRKTNFGEKETVFGVGVVHLGVGSIPITTTLEDPDSPLGPGNRPVIDKYGSKNDIAILLGAARKFKDRYFVGANVKVLMVRQEGASASGFGFDLGVTVPFSYRGLGLLASVSARDITTSFLAWDTGKRGIYKALGIGRVGARKWYQGAGWSAGSGIRGLDSGGEPREKL